MKILITYYSKTGNTKTVAEAMYEVLEKEDAHLMSVKEVEDIGQYSLVFCGFPVHAHSVPVPVHALLKKIVPGQKLALFSTHGSRTDGRMPKEAIEHAIGLAKNAELLGSFTCRGKVEDVVLDDLMGKTEHRAWAMEAASAQGHPDRSDLEDAQVFARGILKKAMKFEDFHKK